MVTAWDTSALSGTTNAGTSPLTWAHTCGASADFILAAFALDGASGITAANNPLSATYNAVAMTGQATWPSGGSGQSVGYLALLSLQNPATGAADNVSGTFTNSGMDGIIGGSASLASGGGSLGTPVHSDSAGAAVTSGTITVTGTTAGSLVVVFVTNGSGGTAFTAGTSRFTSLHGGTAGGAAHSVNCATIAGTGGSVTVTWTQTSDYYAAIAIEVLAGATGGSGTANAGLAHAAGTAGNVSAPRAAIAYNTGTTASAVTSTSVNVVIPGGVLAADVMLMLLEIFCTSSSAPAVGFSGGGTGSWALVPLGSGANPQVAAAASGPTVWSYAYLYWKAATAGDPGATLTVTETGSAGAGTWLSVALAAYTGANGVTPADVAAAAAAQPGSSVTLPTRVTGAAQDWAVYAYGGGFPGSTTVTGPAGTSQRQNVISSAQVGAGIWDSNGAVGAAGTTIGGGTFSGNQAGTYWWSGFTVGLAQTPGAVNAGLATATGTAGNASAVATGSAVAGLAHASGSAGAVTVPPAYIAGLAGGGSGYFADQFGHPRWYQQDAPWGIMGNAGRWNGGNWQADMSNYLSARAAQGFTCIRVHIFGTTKTGAPADNGSTWDGVAPFNTGTDPSSGLNNLYWQRLDYLINTAAGYGITVEATAVFDWDFRGTVFAASWTTAQCTAWGTALATRYLGYANLLWFFGDDYYNDKNTVYNAVINAIRAAGDNRPATIENYPTGTTSRRDLSSTPTGTTLPWGATYANYNLVYYYYPTYFGIEFAYQEPSPIPVIWGDGYYFGDAGGSTGDQVERNMAWWAIASGAHGISTGSDAVWQWPSTAMSAVTSENWFTTVAPKVAQWLTAQAQWYNLLPDLTSRLVISGRGTRTAYNAGFWTGGTDTYVCAAQTPDRSLALIYCSQAFSITIDQTQMAAGYTATWVDPVTLTETPGTAGPAYASGPRGNNSAGFPDWLLVLRGPPVTSAPAGLASGTGTAGNVSPVQAVSAPAGLATAAGVTAANVGESAFAVTPPAGGTGHAFMPSVQTSSSSTAPAQIAMATGTALSLPAGSPAIGANAIPASATGAAPWPGGPVPTKTVDVTVTVGPTTSRAQLRSAGPVQPDGKSVAGTAGDGKAAGNVQGDGKVIGPSVIDRRRLCPHRSTPPRPSTSPTRSRCPAARCPTSSPSAST